MEISSSTKLTGIIGRNIHYSKSPRIHNPLFDKHNIDCVYLSFDLRAQDLQNFLDIAWSMGAIGFNVTQPYKLTMNKLLGTPHHGSVNTLFRGNTGWEATSTDAVGFLHGLRRIKKEIEDFDQIGWIGFGGAAVSICEKLLSLEARHQHSIFVRDATKTHNAFPLLLNRLGADVRKLDAPSLEKFVKESTPKTLLVQASSAPVQGDDLGIFSKCFAGYRGTFVDLIYSKPSALYFDAIRENMSCQDGEAMLIEQARESQKIWFSHSLSYEEIRKILRSS